MIGKKLAQQTCTIDQDQRFSADGDAVDQPHAEIFGKRIAGTEQGQIGFESPPLIVIWQETGQPGLQPAFDGLPDRQLWRDDYLRGERSPQGGRGQVGQRSPQVCLHPRHELFRRHEVVPTPWLRGDGRALQRHAQIGGRDVGEEHGARHILKAGYAALIRPGRLLQEPAPGLALGGP